MRLPMSNPAVASPIGVVFVSVCQRLISLRYIQYCCISCSLTYIRSAFCRNCSVLFRSNPAFCRSLFVVCRNLP